MGQGEPVRQLTGGLVGGLPVERHHGGLNARLTLKLGTPPVADGRDLNPVRTPADRLFEAMNDHAELSVNKEPTFAALRERERASILRGGRAQSSEAEREGAVHSGDCRRARTIESKKNFRSQVV